MFHFRDVVNKSSIQSTNKEVFTGCPDLKARRHGLTKYLLNERIASHPSLGASEASTKSLSLFHSLYNAALGGIILRQPPGFDTPFIEWDHVGAQRDLRQSSSSLRP